MRKTSASVIAHRGARGFAPENTIEAIKKAGQLGAGAVEIDVHVSADGSMVVVHDDDLVRCSDVRRRFANRSSWMVSDFTLPEIQSLDAGSWFVDELLKPIEDRQTFLQSLTEHEANTWITKKDLDLYASGNIRVPTLTECLNVCESIQLKLHIELKSIPRFYPDLGRRVVQEVVLVGRENDVVISSFDHQQLAQVRALAPKIQTAVLTSDRLYRPAEYLTRVGATVYCPGCYGDYDTIGLGSVTGRIDFETILELHESGYCVNVWTENDKRQMQRLLEAGADGIFTDYPNRLVDLLNTLK